MLLIATSVIVFILGMIFIMQRMNQMLSDHMEKVNTKLEEDLESVTEYMEGMNAKISKEFENVSNKAFKENAGIVQDASYKEFLKVVEPLKNEINDYKERMERLVQNDANDREKMKEVIITLTNQNKGFTEEANTFVKALRGDIKSVGDFGENQLELLLSVCGYHPGLHYLRNEALDVEGEKIVPDFTIKLPHGRAIFIDSKLPLDSFMRYIEAHDEKEKKKISEEFAKCVVGHVDSLAKKKYHTCSNFESLEFVLMYVASDNAITVALNGDKTLQTKAMEKGILIVGPTTLMATLKAIEVLNRREKQLENLKEITEVGSHMYTKLRYFFTNLDDAMSSLNTSQDCLRKAIKHLAYGNKSILADAEKLNELGQFSNEPLPELKKVV